MSFDRPLRMKPKRHPKAMPITSISQARTQSAARSRRHPPNTSRNDVACASPNLKATPRSRNKGKVPEGESSKINGAQAQSWDPRVPRTLGTRSIRTSKPAQEEAQRPAGPRAARPPQSGHHVLIRRVPVPTPLAARDSPTPHPRPAALLKRPAPAPGCCDAAQTSCSGWHTPGKSPPSPGL